jgi:hypothetical protein
LKNTKISANDEEPGEALAIGECTQRFFESMGVVSQLPSRNDNQILLTPIGDQILRSASKATIQQRYCGAPSHQLLKRTSSHSSCPAILFIFSVCFTPFYAHTGVALVGI